MSPAFVAVRIAMKCPECLGPVPLNRVSAVGFCHHCQSRLELDSTWPTNVFAKSWTQSPAQWPIGKRDQSSNVSLQLALEVERLPEVPPNAHARTADALAQRVFPGISRLYGEALEGDPTTRPIDQPLLFACLECGAKLRVDGTARVVTCEHCQSATYLSDAMWLRMHPALKRQWFVLEYG